MHNEVFAVNLLLFCYCNVGKMQLLLILAFFSRIYIQYVLSSPIERPISSVNSSNTTLSTATAHPSQWEFLRTIDDGIDKGKNYGGALPEYIRGHFYISGSSIYPTIDIYFNASKTAPFFLTTTATSYRVWGDIQHMRYPSPVPKVVKYFFAWRSVKMDIAEAWSRATDAGWREPLQAFDVFEMDVPYHQVYYRFQSVSEPKKYVRVGASHGSGPYYGIVIFDHDNGERCS